MCCMCRVAVREFGIRALRNHTQEVLDAVDAGDVVFLTRRGVRVAEILRHRVATLDFVRAELADAPRPDHAEASMFGIVSASLGPKLSHNDKWILSRVVLDRSRLVTEDAALDSVARSKPLVDALVALGVEAPDVILVAG